jgi:hypothetical protein
MVCEAPVHLDRDRGPWDERLLSFLTTSLPFRSACPQSQVSCRGSPSRASPRGMEETEVNWRVTGCLLRTSNVVMKSSSVLAGANEKCPSAVWEGKSKNTGVGAGSWARLLRRVFSVDVSTCPRCGPDLEIVSAVTDAGQICR